jgi:hypothetical protein
MEAARHMHAENCCFETMNCGHDARPMHASRNFEAAANVDVDVGSLSVRDSPAQPLGRSRRVH